MNQDGREGVFVGVLTDADQKQFDDHMCAFKFFLKKMDQDGRERVFYGVLTEADQKQFEELYDKMIKMQRTKNAIFYFILCKHCENLRLVDKNIIRKIAHYIWQSHEENCWLF